MPIEWVHVVWYYHSMNSFTRGKTHICCTAHQIQLTLSLDSFHITCESYDHLALKFSLTIILAFLNQILQLPIPPSLSHRLHEWMGSKFFANRKCLTAQHWLSVKMSPKMVVNYHHFCGKISLMPSLIVLSSALILVTFHRRMCIESSYSNILL
jgi:hypothetical protein